MGNRVARLAAPCFAVGDGDRGHHVGEGGFVASTDVYNGVGGDDGSSSSSIGHILSFDGRDGPAKGIGSIHGVLLPSNQSTVGSGAGSLLNDQMSFSGSSSFDSSNSFSFRTLQPGQYSGPLDGSASPSTSATTSGMSVSRRGHGPRTDEQILADLYAVRHRRQRQSTSKSPILGGLRRAVSSVLRGSPCVSPGRDRDGEPFASVTNGGIVGATRNNAEISQGGGDASTNEGAAAAARVQWARGKAGEDRVHVVVSEEHGWMFVGIYDGFNGPDATDYLVAHLYTAVCRELACLIADDAETRPRRHDEVLQALARALQVTEAGYFAEAEARAAECPELAMMGSCVLVVLMKGADVYVMNVGDSRAVLAQQAEPDLSHALAAGVKTEEIVRQYDACDLGELGALQLTMDHSTSVYKEVRRIQSEHLDDPTCIVHGRVKGSLKVTRAFGAGYLKDPRWNRALLEVFRVDYVGASPYISCRPHLRHHQLGSRDKFMILSSDGLYEYFTNEEVVLQVEAFTASYPGEDPAKYLSHEILCRAANRAGMDIQELLEVQQGDRRRYHDDVSIIIVSLEGKIWRS